MAVIQEAPPIAGARLGILSVALAVATFMEVLDTAIANVSVPTISGDLAASPTQGTWVISSYGLAAAIAVPLTGWIARRFGEVRVFVSSVLLFTLASAMCGLAHSLLQLVAFRLFQGLVSGPMVPLSQTLLLRIYPPQKRGLALAIWSMTVVIAPICGPLLGGYITDNMTWPWIFYINVPVGILAGLVCWEFLRDQESPIQRQPIDLVGLVLLIVGVGSLQLMLDNGNDLDWFSSRIIIGLAIAAVIALTVFVVWELTDEHPVVDLTLLGHRNFGVGVIALSFGFMCFFAMNVMFPLWLQTVLGYTASWAGLATAPVGILALLFSPIVGRNVARVDLRILASLAFIIFSVTTFWFSTFSMDTPFRVMVLPRILQGAAIACFFIPVNSIIISGIAPERMAAASGLSNFFRTLSGSFGTSLVVMLWDNRMRFHRLRLSEHIQQGVPAFASYTQQLHHLGLKGMHADAYVLNLLSTHSYMIATAEVFRTGSLIFITLISIIWLTKPPFSAGVKGGGH